MSNNEETINMWYLDIRGISFSHSHFENISFIDTDISDVYFDEMKEMQAVRIIDAHSGRKSIPLNVAWIIETQTEMFSTRERYLLDSINRSRCNTNSLMHNMTVERLRAFIIRSGKCTEDEVKSWTSEGIDRSYPHKQ